MGLLSNLRDKSETVFVKGDNTYTLEIIKESDYQSHLKKVCGGYSKEGNEHDEVASLYYDNKKSQDKQNKNTQAIRVVIKKKTVGYLCDDDAKRYRKRLKRLSEEGIVIECNAKIFGGTNLGFFDKTSFEVWLDLNIKDLEIKRSPLLEKEAATPSNKEQVLPIDL